MLSEPSNTVQAIYRLTQEIDKLTEQQAFALQMAIQVGMTPEEAQEYDQRRNQIFRYIQDLAMLEESQ